MAEIHVLDAHRGTAQIARLTANLAKLSTDGTELGPHGHALRSEAAHLRKQAALLHYLRVQLHLEMDALAASTRLAHPEKKGLLEAAQRMSVSVEKLIRNIRRLPA
ncbi:hypothetical protein [Methylobacterium nigriterrae]|uniref:hypothetical protein n=1 Tax=Methylobacterium nigriterrae TaxID=3127512 RepID=UPI003013BC9A